MDRPTTVLALTPTIRGLYAACLGALDCFEFETDPAWLFATRESSERGGAVVPRDVTVIGFDNIPAGAFCMPSPTSVNQRFDEIGSLAGRLVLAQIGGWAVAPAAFTAQAAVVTVRESCGCVAGATAADVGYPADPDGSVGLWRDELQDVRCGALRTDADVGAQGVETADQLAALQALACATAQGYLFMPTVPFTAGPGATE